MAAQPDVLDPIQKLIIDKFLGGTRVLDRVQDRGGSGRGSRLIYAVHREIGGNISIPPFPFAAASAPGPCAIPFHET